MAKKKGDEQLRRALAETLRELRRMRLPDLSQTEFSRQIGFDAAGLERAERLPSLGVVWPLAKAFQVSPARVVALIDRHYHRLQRGTKGDDSTAEFIEFKRLRKLMDQAVTMKWLADRHQRCVYENQRLLDYVGATREELRRDGWQKLIHPENLEQHIAAHVKAFARREPYLTRFQMRRADGTYQMVVQTAFPQFTPKGGTFFGFLGSIIPEPDNKIASL